MPEANRSASASNPSSNTAEDRRPGTLDPNLQVPPVANPRDAAAVTPEPTVKRPDQGDKGKPAAVGETDRCDTESPPLQK